MGWARERVVPAESAGAWARSAGLGLSTGLLTGALLPWVSLWGLSTMWLPAHWFMAQVWIVDGVVLALATLPLLVMLRVSQRWSVVLGFAAAHMGGLAVSSMIVETLRRSDGGADLADAFGSEELMGAAVLIPGFVALAAMLRMAVRTVIVRVEECTPDGCAWCGYRRGSEAVVRCPECGRDASPARFRMHRLVCGVPRLARRWAVVLVCVVVGLGACAVWPILTRTIPCARFYAAFPGATRLDSSFRLQYVLPDCPMVWKAAGGRPDRGLRATFEPGAGSRDWRMTVDVTGAPGVGAPMGAASVITHLNADQTRSVLAHGLPAELERALYAKADEIAWTPASAPRGKWEVPASPFFQGSP